MLAVRIVAALVEQDRDWKRAEVGFGGPRKALILRLGAGGTGVSGLREFTKLST